MKKYFPIFIIVIVVVLAGISLFIFWRMQNFSKDDVSFEIIGPKEVEVGMPEDFAFLCTNKSRKDLENIKITLEYSTGIIETATSLPLTKTLLIENIPGKGAGKKQIRLSVFGKKDDKKLINAKIEFSPKKSKKAYFIEAKKEILIMTSPFFVRIDTPTQTTTGQEINFSIEYTSRSNNLIPNFAMRAIYPQGFQFIQSNLNPKLGNNVWVFGGIKPKNEGSIQVRGNISGIKEENKSFKAELGVMIGNDFLPIYEESKALKVLGSLLAVEQVVNGSSDYAADYGETLNFSVKYKNNTKEKLREVFINTEIKCEYAMGGEANDCLSWKELKVVGGEFDGFSKTLSWKASGVPSLQELAPGEEGEVKFVARLNNELLVKSETDRNIILRTISKIDMNPQLIPKSLFQFKINNESTLITKVNSKINLSVKGYYNHKSIQNSGPIPPRVGQITTYAIVWNIGNSSNDLKEAVVEARLPSNIVWKDKFFPKDANIKYQPFVGTIVWKIGDIKAGSGIYLPSKEVVFQVALQPTKNLIDREVNLLEDIKIEGIDSFTGEVLKTSVEKISTNIPDENIMRDQGKVLP